MGTSTNPSFPRRRESKFSTGRDIATKLDSRLRGNDGNFRLIEVPQYRTLALARLLALLWLKLRYSASVCHYYAGYGNTKPDRAFTADMSLASITPDAFTSNLKLADVVA